MARFQSIVDSGRRGPRSRAAMQWFTRQVRAVLTGRTLRTEPTAPGQTPLQQRPDVISVRRRIDQNSVGKMYTFAYDPKYKATLPYYDIYPLIFVIGLYPKGFLGINLHYLPPDLRARMMDALDTVKNNDRYNATTKLLLSYQVLQSHANMSFYKPCVKRYLSSHVGSQYGFIPAQEWDMAVILPTQRFVKASDAAVWEDSRNKLA